MQNMMLNLESGNKILKTTNSWDHYFPMVKLEHRHQDGSKFFHFLLDAIKSIQNFINPGRF